MAPVNLDLSQFEKAATEVAGILRALANERRLMVLCELASVGEASVGHLAEVVELSQSALSQHLALLREAGLVTTHREAQSIFYSLPAGPVVTK